MKHEIMRQKILFYYLKSDNKYKNYQKFIKANITIDYEFLQLFWETTEHNFVTYIDINYPKLLILSKCNLPIIFYLGNKHLFNCASKKIAFLSTKQYSYDDYNYVKNYLKSIKKKNYLIATNYNTGFGRIIHYFCYKYKIKIVSIGKYEHDLKLIKKDNLLLKLYLQGNLFISEPTIDSFKIYDFLLSFTDGMFLSVYEKKDVVKTVLNIAEQTNKDVYSFKSNSSWNNHLIKNSTIIFNKSKNFIY